MCNSIVHLHWLYVREYHYIATAIDDDDNVCMIATNDGHRHRISRARCTRVFCCCFWGVRSPYASVQCRDSRSSHTRTLRQTIRVPFRCFSLCQCGLSALVGSARVRDGAAANSRQTATPMHHTIALIVTHSHARIGIIKPKCMKHRTK